MVGWLAGWLVGTGADLTDGRRLERIFLIAILWPNLIAAYYYESIIAFASDADVFMLGLYCSAVFPSNCHCHCCNNCYCFAAFSSFVADVVLFIVVVNVLFEQIIFMLVTACAVSVREKHVLSSLCCIVLHCTLSMKFIQRRSQSRPGRNEKY